MIAREYDKRIQICATENIPNESGGSETIEHVIAESWAKIETNGVGNKLLSIGLVVFEDPVLFRVRYRNDLQYEGKTMFVVYRNYRYAIQAIRDNNERQRELEIFTARGEAIEAPIPPLPDNGQAEAILTTTAGMDLSGGRVITIVDGKAVYYDPNDETMYGEVVGITQDAALSGQQVKVQLDGLYYEAGLGLIPDQLYFAGLNGQLTLNPSGLKTIQSMGSSVDANRLSIKINSQPILTL